VGGIQTVMHELAHRLVTRWAVTVIAPGDPDSRRYDAEVPFPVVRTRAQWAESRLRTLGEMTALGARHPSEVVFAGHVHALPAACVNGHGRLRVGMMHGGELWAHRTRVLTHVLGPRLHLALAVSRFTAREAARSGIPPERIVVTPPGANPPLPQDGEEEILRALGLVDQASNARVPFFLTVSRLDPPHKGQDMFIRALPEVLARRPEVRYVIAGEGDLATELHALACRLGVGEAVVMAGLVDERTKSTLLRACRTFVMLSRESRKPALFEGFGIAFLEAALAGRPSLAGDSGGVRDAVVHEQTGLVVDPLSLPDITRAALRLLDDRAYCDDLGRRAHARAWAGYTWDAAAARIEHRLESALSLAA
jgi:phosphatidylinositol alpha-1,6-mannosyltransferase